MLKRILCVLLLCVMAIIPSLWRISAQAEINSTIRVYLRRLGIEDTVRIQTSGSYMLQDGSMLFRDGTDMTIALRAGQLILHTGSSSIRIGDQMKLVRCEPDGNGSLTINGSGAYEGDLLLKVSSDVIRPILYIHIEDYLLGVVPYEMGDSFPLEALKAQAIAARTYALRKSGSSGDYDVEDTTNDQAYRGRASNSPLSEQAVLETVGLCGTYNGYLAQCYYSASNGGQTELGQHVWPTSEPDAYGYMDMRDDPYDFENPDSIVKRYTLPKKTKKAGVGDALHQVLVSALGDKLMALGAQTEPDCVRIDEVIGLELSEPKYEGDSRLMTHMAFTLRISVRDCLYRDPGDIVSDSQTNELLSAEAEPTPSPTPRPTATPSYSKYRAVNDPVSVTVPIFPGIEQAMGLSISTSKNELITVTDIGSAYMIESRRYGHGVGMSQRGAEQMAGKHGMKYDEILSFYYPGMILAQYELPQESVQTPDMMMMATPAPTPSPTPRPTLMPVTEGKIPKGSYLAIVTNISEDSSLNLREAPNMSAEVIRRLYKNQKLIVMNVSRDGWAHVKTDVIEGYVRNEYLQSVGK